MALQRKCKNIKSLFSGEKCNYQNKLKVHFAVTVIATLSTTVNKQKSTVAPVNKQINKYR